MDSVVSAQHTSPVVAGVDGSRNGPVTIDLAAAEAVRHRAPLLIVHVWPGRYTGVFRGRSGFPSEADGRHLLEVSASRARRAAPDLRIGTELLDGGAANALARCSDRARLIVVGHRDEVAGRLSWGSTTAYLAHHSACPLLVHRGAAAHQAGPVVVAASARPAWTATIGYAFAEADLLNSRLVAVHAWTRAAARDDRLPTGGYAAERQAAERALAEALAGWSADFPDVSVERLLVQDPDVVYTIERASQRGRLLIAGRGRNGRFAELLYRSLSPAAIRHALCPVVLVPPDWRAGAARAVRSGPAVAGPR